MSFSLFDALSIGCGIDQLLAARIEAACLRCEAGVEVQRLIAASCARGYIKPKDYYTLCTQAPGLISERNLADKLIRNSRLPWVVFVDLLCLERD
jgi:hypothetical protein